MPKDEALIPADQFLALISSTQAVLLYWQDKRFSQTVLALRTVFSNGHSQVISARTPVFLARSGPRSMISGINSSAFSLNLTPLQNRRSLKNSFRIVGRVSGQSHDQLLMDGTIDFADDTVFRASARMDWNGEEILFPSQSTVGICTGVPKESLQFGCAPRESGDAGFFYVTDGQTVRKYPADLKVPNAVFNPLSDPVQIISAKNKPKYVQCGFWSMPTFKSVNRLIGMRISPKGEK